LNDDAKQQHIIPVADTVIHRGRYGLFVWLMWLWPIRSVADIVQTLWNSFTAAKLQTNNDDPVMIKVISTE